MVTNGVTISPGPLQKRKACDYDYNTIGCDSSPESPADSSAIMQGYPGSASETIANGILNRHIGCKCGPVIYIRCFPVRGIGS